MSEQARRVTDVMLSCEVAIRVIGTKEELKLRIDAAMDALFHGQPEGNWVSLEAVSNLGNETYIIDVRPDAIVFLGAEMDYKGPLQVVGVVVPPVKTHDEQGVVL